MARNRILAQGRPGTRKTGALAALANAGYVINLIDLEGNLAPLINNTKPEFRKNLHIAKVRDRIVSTDAGVASCSNPIAFRKCWTLLDNFVYTDLESGEEMSAGSAGDWGDDTILSIDGLTQQGEAAQRRIMGMMGRTVLNRRKQDWGVVQHEIAQYYSMLEANTACHIYVMCHLKMIGPKLLDSEDAQGPDISEEQAEEINGRMVNVIPTRLYPLVPGQQLAQSITGQFDNALLFEAKETANGNVKLVIHTTPQPGVDVKCTAPGVAAELPTESGLLTIFEAIAKEQGQLAKLKPAITKPKPKA